MKEFKLLTESQTELLHMKNMQIQDGLDKTQDMIIWVQKLQKQNTERIERMKSEPGVDIPQAEIGQWQLSKDGKNFERKKKIKKDIPGNRKKDKK